MKRKPVLLGLGVILSLAVGAGFLVCLLRYEPAFYREAMVAPGAERQKVATKCSGEFVQFAQDVAYNREWKGWFRQDAINSFFEEQLAGSGWSSRFLPEGFSDLRLAIEPDRLRLGFRYQVGPFRPVVSIDMRVWLAAKELNVVALELRGLHAGALPISAQALLERISESARQNNVDVTWYRYEGNPVAILRFQSDQDRPTFRLEHLVLHAGDGSPGSWKGIEVRGRSSEAPSLRAMLTPADGKRDP